MGKLLTMLQKGKSKTTALVAVVAAAIVIPASLYAWGPTRTTYTIEQPADHVTFNSITNNPNIGDERNFVGIRDASAQNVWHDEMNVEKGKEYVVRMYVHNNAAANLGLVAENTTAHVTLPTNTGRSIQIDGAVSASNATPGTVYDHATFTGEQDFNLAYIPGTLKYETNKGTFDIPETVFDQRGALLGYDKLDGKVPGCFEYAGYLTFRVKPQFAETINFDMSKKVSQHGKNDWKDSYAAKPGETVDYLIQYKNTGTAQQDNVVLKDTLPEGMQYVPGSTVYGTSAKPAGQQASDNIVTDAGINIGSYAPNAGTWARFSAKVPAKDALECGNNVLKNVARVETDGGQKEDDADVTVDVECEQPEPVYTCTALGVSNLGDNKFRFETGYNVTGGEFKSVSYTIRDSEGTVIDTIAGAPNAANYTQATPGTYSVQAIVTFVVNGKDVTATGEACKKEFTVPTPPTPSEIVVCDIENREIITISEDEFDEARHTTDLSKCDEVVPGEIEVCEIETGTIVTVPENEFDEARHTTDLNQCDEETPVAPTPTELPRTGVSGGSATAAGLALFALVAGYAVTARRTLG